MTEPQSDDFTDLRGRALERLDLTGADIRRVRLHDARLRRVVLTDAVVRSSYLGRTRLVGVELEDVEITGAIQNLTINGVEVGEYVETQLNLRDPERAKMRATTPEEFREAWTILERRWADTVARARTLEPELLQVSVDEEWSFTQTLRHLSFATAAWLHRGVLGEPAPWHPLDLPWDEAPPMPRVPRDREARPPLDEVLAVREARVADVRAYLATVTADELARPTATLDDEVGFPPGGLPVAECLRVILIEEWEHRNYAERDLDRVVAQAQESPSDRP